MSTENAAMKANTAANYEPKEAAPVAQPEDGNLRQQRDLDTIKKDIDRHQESYAQSFLEIGRLLLEAKSIFGKHGDWIKWLQENVDMSISKAQRLMRVAETFSNKAPVPYLDYSKAYILTALPARDLDAFVSSLHNVDGQMKLVKNMTKRELETVVRNHLKTRKNKPAATPSPTDSKDDTGKETESSSFEVNFATRLESIKNYMDELVELIEKRADDLSTHDALVAELRELCNDTIQKLPSEELESM